MSITDDALHVFADLSPQSKVTALTNALEVLPELWKKATLLTFCHVQAEEKTTSEAVDRVIGSK